MFTLAHFWKVPVFFLLVFIIRLPLVRRFFLARRNLLLALVVVFDVFVATRFYSFPNFFDRSPVDEFACYFRGFCFGFSATIGKSFPLSACFSFRSFVASAKMAFDLGPGVLVELDPGLNQHRSVSLLGSLSVLPVFWYTTEASQICVFFRSCSSNARGVLLFCGAYTNLLFFSKSKFISTSAHPLAHLNIASFV